MMIDPDDIPADFKYRDVLLKGRPRHDKFDPFLIENLAMPTSQWVKIYAPFDALRGFSEAITTKTILYEEKRIPGEDEQEELNRKIRALKEMTANSRTRRQEPVTVSVTYFRPCSDVDSDAYG